MLNGIPADYLLYGVSLGLSLLLAALSVLGGPMRTLGGHGLGHGHAHGQGLGRLLGRGSVRGSGRPGHSTSQPVGQGHGPIHVGPRAPAGAQAHGQGHASAHGHQQAHQPGRLLVAPAETSLPGYSLSNPIAFMSFLGGFGAFGFIARGAGAGLGLALALALGGSIALSLVLFQLFTRLVLASDGSTGHLTEEAVGKLGTITVAIPTSGHGAVAYAAGPPA
jgi:hypothetical protein